MLVNIPYIECLGMERREPFLKMYISILLKIVFFSIVILVFGGVYPKWAHTFHCVVSMSFHTLLVYFLY